MRKYAVIYRSVLMETLQYALNVVVGLITYFVIVFIFIQLWNYMYSSPSELIAGYSKEQMIWYVMITEILWFGARTNSMARQTAADIKGGNIAYLMNKPYHYTLYILTKYTGEWSIRLPIYALFSTIVGMFMVGKIPGFRLVTLVAAVPVIALGVTIHGTFKLCISLFSFWIEDSTPFQWIYDKLFLIIGILFPVELFPETVQPILKLTPIYTVCYGPAKLLVDFQADKYLEILLAQILYLGLGFCLMFFLYGKGVKKLYVNGG